MALLLSINNSFFHAGIFLSCVMPQCQRPTESPPAVEEVDAGTRGPWQEGEWIERKCQRDQYSLSASFPSFARLLSLWVNMHNRFDF